MHYKFLIVRVCGYFLLSSLLWEFNTVAGFLSGLFCIQDDKRMGNFNCVWLCHSVINLSREKRLIAAININIPQNLQVTEKVHKFQVCFYMFQLISIDWIFLFEYKKNFFSPQSKEQVVL